MPWRLPYRHSSSTVAESFLPIRILFINKARPAAVGNKCSHKVKQGLYGFAVAVMQAVQLWPSTTALNNSRQCAIIHSLSPEPAGTGGAHEHPAQCQKHGQNTLCLREA